MLPVCRPSDLFSFPLASQSADSVGFDKKITSKCENPGDFLTGSSVCVCLDHAGGFKYTTAHRQRMTNALRSSEAVINVSVNESRGASVCRNRRLVANQANYTLSTHSFCQRDITALGLWLITGIMFYCVSDVLTEQAS